MKQPPPYIGIDGCPRGWVAIGLDDQGFSEAFLAPNFAELLDRCAESQVIAVDIPIGLTDVGFREADLTVRSFLRGRASSLFTTPPRSALEAEEYAAACELSRKLTGKAFSRQSWALKKKIMEVDPFIGDSRIWEVHPEVSFRLMADHDLTYSKKTWGGQQERRHLLESVGVRVPDHLGEADRAGADDVLDAAAAAWTARRIAQGEARSFPEDSEQSDRSGRVIAIWG